MQKSVSEVVAIRCEANLILTSLKNVCVMEHALTILGPEQFTSLTEILKVIQNNYPLIERIENIITTVGMA